MARASRTRRTVTVVVVIAVLAAAAAAAYWFWGRRPAAQPAATTQSVAASLTTQQQTVSASGTFVPAQQANLNFAASGTVTSVTAVVGQHVTAGTTLATIDPTALTNAVTQAQAGLESAQAQQNAAQSNTSATQAQLDSAQAAVNAAQAKLQAAQNAVANATLTSPIDGTVAAVTIAPGTTVSAASSTSGQAGGSGGGSGSGGQGAGSGQGGSGQYSGSQGGSGAASGGGSSSSSNAQIVVINTSSWLVQASVTAADLPSIKTGLQTQITPTGTTQKVFGTVSSVGVIGSTSGGTATFPVVIAVTGAPTGIYDGSTGDVAIIVKQYTDILTIPTAAVLTENGQTVVHQTKDGKQVSTPVTVGMIFGNLTEITQGLAEGDEVLVTTSGGRPGRGGSANPSAGGTPRTRGGYGSGGNGSGSNAGVRGTGQGSSGQGGSGSGSGQSDLGNR